MDMILHFFNPVLDLFRTGFNQVNALLGLIIALIASFQLSAWKKLWELALAALAFHIVALVLAPAIDHGAPIRLPALLDRFRTTTLGLCAVTQNTICQPCTLDTDCVGSGRPFCVSGMCVACKTSSQCNNDAGAPFCSAQNTCVSCASATGDGGICSGAAPMCDPGSGRCVECVRNGDCPTAAKAFCVANQCQGCDVPGASAGGGGSDGGVRDGGGIDAGFLGPCVGAKPVCSNTGTVAGQCVQCGTVIHSDGTVTVDGCSGSTPICSSANTCTTCTTDSQCSSLGGGPGICMFHQDGRCAAESETR